jgi:hypothetical protein
MGFLEVLTLIFITLKLVGSITWPWVWVLAPLWIGYAVLGAIFILIFIIAVIASMFGQ